MFKTKPISRVQIKKICFRWLFIMLPIMAWLSFHTYDPNKEDIEFCTTATGDVFRANFKLLLIIAPLIVATILPLSLLLRSGGCLFIILLWLNHFFGVSSPSAFSPSDYTRIRLGSIAQKINDYRRKYGKYPSVEGGLLEVKKHYPDVELVDYWGTPYYFTPLGSSYVLKSAGCNKVFGTKTEISYP